MNKSEKQKPQFQNNPILSLMICLTMVLMLNGVVYPILTGNRVIETDYGSFIEEVNSGNVTKVLMKDNTVYFSVKKEGGVTNFKTGMIDDPGLVMRLLNADSPNDDGKIIFTKSVPKENSPILSFVLMWVLPGLLFYLGWKGLAGKMSKKMQGGGNFMSFGNSAAKVYADKDVNTTFADVAG